jgi:hypothetical protein
MVHGKVRFHGWRALMRFPRSEAELSERGRYENAGGFYVEDDEPEPMLDELLELLVELLLPALGSGVVG